MNSSFLPGWAHMYAEERSGGSRAAASGRRASSQQRALAVHDLVVGERQDEVLVQRIDEREGQLVVVEATMDRVVLEVAQRVVHPAHVPLEAEAEPADVGGPRDRRPGRRLLGGRDHSRLARMDELVHLLEERDRLQVLAAAVAVRHPLALLAGVVEVEHRGDRVDAQPVDVVLAQPEERVREQEVAHLAAAEVEDERAPVGMRAAPRVGMLVERGAVELRERPRRRAGNAPAPSRGSRRGRAACRRSTKYRKSSGVPKRRVWGRSSRSPGSPTSPQKGCCITGSSSTWVKPRSAHVGGELVGERSASRDPWRHEEACTS